MLVQQKLSKAKTRKGGWDNKKRKKRKKEKEEERKEKKKKRNPSWKSVKDRLDSMRVYPSWKHVKGGSDRGGYCRNAIQSWKSHHQRDETESEVLIKRIKIIKRGNILGEEFWKSDLDDTNVHYSNTLLYLQNFLK